MGGFDRHDMHALAVRPNRLDRPYGDADSDIFCLLPGRFGSSIISLGTEMPGILAFMNSAIFWLRSKGCPARP